MVTDFKDLSDSEKESEYNKLLEIQKHQEAVFEDAQLAAHILAEAAKVAKEKIALAAEIAAKIIATQDDANLKALTAAKMANDVLKLQEFIDNMKLDLENITKGI